MNRSQYVGALAVLAVAGMIGGALSNAFLTGSTAVAQRSQIRPKPKQAPQILTPRAMKLPKVIDCEKLRLVDGDGDEIAVLRLKGAADPDVLLERTDGLTLEIGNGASSIRFEPAGLRIESSSTLTVAAPLVQVDSGMSKFSGVVQCDTIIADSVVGTSYTPGAGNVW